MNILCKIFGHKSLERVHTGGEYVKTVGHTVDGIGREHVSLYGECPRCGDVHRVGKMHLVQRQQERELLKSRFASTTTCTKPPPGYTCTRPFGHDGPCAVPLPEPIDMVLHCPVCNLQHIDKDNSEEIRIQAAELGVDREGDRAYSDWLEEHEWTNPPHRSHLCAGCGHIWRPADVPTNGVEAVKTIGSADSPRAMPQPKPFRGDRS